MLCNGGRKSIKRESSSRTSSAARSTLAQPKPKIKKIKRYDSDSEEEIRQKQADTEGIPDLYRAIIDRVKAAAPESIGPEPIADLQSPDWRTSHEQLQDLLGQWQQQPSYMPRIGELVLFTRSLSVDVDECIAWDPLSQTLRRVDLTTKTWLDRPRWEVGVVTQLPTEPVTEEDLTDASHKKQSVNYSGFRVELLSDPGAEKGHSQYKFVPLHAIRPFTYWRDCLSKDRGKDKWSPTINHALTVASSLCLVGKYSFLATWPSVTIFFRALYLGPELIMVGDVVRLTPKDNQKDTVTDVVVVSSIRFKIVNLDQATDDDYDDKEFYNVCVHICGKAYTQDPKRSFDGLAKAPVRSEEESVPSILSDYGSQGKWYHLTDPKESKAKLEVPYTRLLGKCLPKSALQQWFSTPEGMSAPTAFQPVAEGGKKPADVSHGLKAVREARKYSLEHDSRIKTGQNWFWAETRIEQLELHEVNGKYVGDKGRTKKQVNAWRQALKVLDGKQGSLDNYHAARAQREQEQRNEAPTIAPGYGMMASAVQIDSATDGETVEAGNNDEDMLGEDGASSGGVNAGGVTEGDDAMILDHEEQEDSSGRPRETEVIDLDGDDGDDDLMIMDT